MKKNKITNFTIMKKNIRHKIDSIRNKAYNVSAESITISAVSESTVKEKSSLSEAIRNKKEAESFRIAYESAKSLARSK